MAEGSGEKVSRRGFLKGVLWGGLAALGLSQAPRVMRGLEEHRWDPTRSENLRDLLGAEELFPGWHPYFKGKIKLREGASLYKEPRMGKSPEQGVSTIPTTGNTFLGTLGEGEEILVERPFLFLKEADVSTPEAWVISLENEGVTKKADVSRSWIIFDIKRANLPKSIRGDSPYGIACLLVTGGGIEFIPEEGKDTILLEPQSVAFERELSFGKVTP